METCPLIDGKIYQQMELRMSNPGFFELPTAQLLK
jgi:hypothetical protein